MMRLGEIENRIRASPSLVLSLAHVVFRPEASCAVCALLINDDSAYKTSALAEPAQLPINSLSKCISGLDISIFVNSIECPMLIGHCFRALLFPSYHCSPPAPHFHFKLQVVTIEQPW